MNTQPEIRIVSATTIETSSSGRSSIASHDEDEQVVFSPPEHSDGKHNKAHFSVTEEEYQGTWLSSHHASPQAGWKPLSMSPVILGTMMVLTILLIATIEVLAQHSRIHGGFALSPTLDDIPEYADIAQEYVPNALAVLYTLFWSWIDLDVKRMQPWLELSKPGGALAELSLVLDYPHDFIAFAPIRAFRRRHWPVFYAGTITALVFWTITPLQSAILGIGEITQSKLLNIDVRAALWPIVDQQPLLDPKVTLDAYSTAWLGQSYPPFITKDNAYLPFYANEEDLLSKTGLNLTANTTRYWTELDCWPADVVKAELQGAARRYEISSGRGCAINITTSVASGAAMHYIGYLENPYSSYYLRQDKTCPETEDTVHQFLAIASKTINPLDPKLAATPEQREAVDFQLTASFCQARYWKQQVSLMIDGHTMTPYENSTSSLADAEILSETEFNSTAFEYLLAAGKPEEDTDPLISTKDLPYNFRLEQHTRFASMELQKPVSHMVGFAIAAMGIGNDKYQSHDALHRAYDQAHKGLFGAAINVLLRNTTEERDNMALATHHLSGIVVSRSIATTVEVLLLVVCIMTAILLWACRRAPSKLVKNPSSVSRMMEVFRNSPHATDAFKAIDQTDIVELTDTFKGRTFHLCLEIGSGDPTLICHDNVADLTYKAPAGQEKGNLRSIRPMALRARIGILFIAVMLGGLIVLFVLRAQQSIHNGLERPSNNPEVLRLLQDIIPTLFTTFVESFWILLIRYLCVLQPFKDLWAGKARRERSIDVTYSAVPPQLSLWRALKARHILLFIVGSVGVLLNILTALAGGLFTESEMTAHYASDFQATYAPRFDNESINSLLFEWQRQATSTGMYTDPFLVTMYNYTKGTSLPPWVSPDYYFLPQEVADPAGIAAGDQLRVRTSGFGFTANCRTQAPVSVPLTFTDAERAPVVDSARGCPSDISITEALIEMRESRAPSASNVALGASAFEYSGVVLTGDACTQNLILAFGRTANASDFNATTEASSLTCRPMLEIGVFDVDIDPRGYVQNYTQVGDLQHELDYPLAASRANILVDNLNSLFIQGSAQWHNSTKSTLWLGHMILSKTGSRTFLDPNQPLPDVQTLLPTIDVVVRRVSAVFLALNAKHIFEPATGPFPSSFTRHSREIRIFLSTPALIITQVILTITIIVAILYYVRAVVFVFPRMPTTIGSVLAYVAPSRLVQDPRTWQDGDKIDLQTYSYGRYRATDGSVHIGIEKDPFVVPVDPASLGEGRSRYWANKFGLGKLRRRKVPFDHGPWL